MAGGGSPPEDESASDDPPPDGGDPAIDDDRRSTGDHRRTADGGDSIGTGPAVGDVAGEANATADSPFGLPRWVLALLPLVLLAVVLTGFVATAPFADIQQGEPLPDVTVSHHTVPDDGTIVLHVTNDGAEAQTIQQVLVDDAYWNHRVVQDGHEQRTIQPSESARVVIPYHWQQGWDYDVGLVLEGGPVVHHQIVAIQQTPSPGLGLLGDFALIGLFVGVIPVALGMCWFPFIRTMEPRWLHAVLAFSAGLLAFLAVDAGFEALELADRVPGAYEGTLLVALGVVGAALSVQAISSWRERRFGGRDGGLFVAYLVALGIGLHNLAEGLAIGSSFALGRASLGAFLVIGFMLHNVTEGPAVVAPVARGERDRPSLWHFVALGAIAGAPVVLGGWIGSSSLSPTVGAFFLAIGVGAIVQVCWELGELVRDDGGRIGSATNLLALLAGFAVMYATDLLVVL